ESVVALGVGLELPPQIALGLNARLLHIVEAILAGLPDVEHGTGERAAAGSRHPAVHHAGLALAVLGDAGTQGKDRCAGDMERSEYGRLRGAVLRPMIDRLDQHRDSHRIGQEDPFLAPAVADLTGAREEVDRGHPFVDRRLDLLDEGMEMANRALD